MKSFDLKKDSSGFSDSGRLGGFKLSAMAGSAGLGVEDSVVFMMRVLLWTGGLVANFYTVCRGIPYGRCPIALRSETSIYFNYNILQGD
jgi:hypothetical protein